jgi:hypothetical protein
MLYTGSGLESGQEAVGFGTTNLINWLLFVMAANWQHVYPKHLTHSLLYTHVSFHIDFASINGLLLWGIVWLQESA